MVVGCDVVGRDENTLTGMKSWFVDFIGTYFNAVSSKFNVNIVPDTSSFYSKMLEKHKRYVYSISCEPASLSSPGLSATAAAASTVPITSASASMSDSLQSHTVARISSFEQQLSALNAAVTSLTAKEAVHSHRINEVETALANLQTTYPPAMDGLRGRLPATEEPLEAASSQPASPLNAAVISLRAKEALHSHQINEIETELADLQSSYSSAMTVLRGRLLATEEALEAATNRVSQQGASIALIDVDIAALRRQASAIEAKATAALEAVKKL